MGATSYRDITTGLALVLVAIVIAWTARETRPIGYLLGLSRLAYLAQGWLIGTAGFTPATTVPTDAGYSLLVAAMIWTCGVAWRMDDAGTAVGRGKQQHPGAVGTRVLMPPRDLPAAIAGTSTA